MRFYSKSNDFVKPFQRILAFINSALKAGRTPISRIAGLYISVLYCDQNFIELIGSFYAPNYMEDERLCGNILLPSKFQPLLNSVDQINVGSVSNQALWSALLCALAQSKLFDDLQAAWSFILDPLVLQAERNCHIVEFLINRVFQTIDRNLSLPANLEENSLLKKCIFVPALVELVNKLELDLDILKSKQKVCKVGKKAKLFEFESNDQDFKSIGTNINSVTLERMKNYKSLISVISDGIRHVQPLFVSSFLLDLMSARNAMKSVVSIICKCDKVSHLLSSLAIAFSKENDSMQP
jgi:hypothetical protein